MHIVNCIVLIKWISYLQGDTDTEYLLSSSESMDEDGVNSEVNNTTTPKKRIGDNLKVITKKN